MGFVNQGWFARCDNCDETDSDSIHSGDCRKKWQVERDVKRAGWSVYQRHGTKLVFCSEDCRNEWQEKNK